MADIPGPRQSRPPIEASVAGKSKTKLSDDSTVTASVGIGPRDAGEGFGIAVGLEISLPGLSRAQAEELVAKAHIVCPYSYATRGNIDVRLSVV